VNHEPFVVGKSLGAARTMNLNTPLYIGGVDRRKITINPDVGVERGFRGCISEVSKTINYKVDSDIQDN